jgi:hypothetical protein
MDVGDIIHTSHSSVLPWWGYNGFISDAYYFSEMQLTVGLTVVSLEASYLNSFKH